MGLRVRGDAADDASDPRALCLEKCDDPLMVTMVMEYAGGGAAEAMWTRQDERS